MKNDKKRFDFPYDKENPFFYQRDGLAVMRELNTQKDYIIKGRVVGLLWDIAWNVNEYLGVAYNSTETEKQPKEVILNKLMFLNGKLAEVYNEFIFEMPEILEQTYYKLGELKKWKIEDYYDKLTEEEIDTLTSGLNKRLKQKYCNSESQV